MSTYSFQYADDPEHGGYQENTTDNPDKILIFGKYLISKRFLEIIRKYYFSISFFLVEGAEYSAAELCGKAVWEYMADWDRRQAVLCLTYMTTLPQADICEATCEMSQIEYFRKL